MSDSAKSDTPFLKPAHPVRTGSVVLHELSFENLGGNGKADIARERKVAPRNEAA